MRRLTVVLALACGGFRPAATVTPVVSSKLPVGAEVAIVELGDATYAFDRTAVNVVRGGKIVARVGSPGGAPWRAAATVASPDGSGRWVVGVSGGMLWRVLPGGLEAASERLGIASARVLAIDSAGATSIIGVAGGELVATDAAHVMRFTGPDAQLVAAARDRVAIGTDSGIDVYDLTASTKVSYAIDASYLAFRDATTDHATLVAATGDKIYEEKAGKLVAMQAPAQAQLAVSGSRLWLLAGGQLYADDPRGIVAIGQRGTQIFGSRTGGVWLAQAAAATRFTLDASTEDPAWHSAVEPVFQRVCSSCHLPDGDADLDLSTAAAWKFRRREIIHRVLDERTMPPAGTTLGEADRQALATWLTSGKVHGQ